MKKIYLILAMITIIGCNAAERKEFEQLITASSTHITATTTASTTPVVATTTPIIATTTDATSTAATAPPVIETTTPPVIETTTPPVIVYYLRDAGPAGGLIFYDKGSYSDGWRYMEAAPVDQSMESCWFYRVDGRYEMTNATGTAIGTGKTNTIIIIAKQSANIKAGGWIIGMYDAANVCVIYNGGGYNDWFLPSTDELNLMYENLYLYNVGGFRGDGNFYWSSSENSQSLAWTQRFQDGWQTLKNKYNKMFVRAARKF
jgi:hypothetical protein